MSKKVVLTGKDRTLEQVYAVVFEHVRATLANEARNGIEPVAGTPFFENNDNSYRTVYATCPSRL